MGVASDAGLANATLPHTAPEDANLTEGARHTFMPLRRAFLIGAALALPWLLPLLSHVLIAKLRGLHPTGFINYEMAYYMANAREAFDAARDGGFTPWYGNPFTFDAHDAPRIYFQPLIFVLGVVAWASRLDPGVVFVIANVIGVLLCAVVAIRLYEAVTDRIATTSGRLTLVSFFWGGGLLCLAGLALSLLRYGDGRDMLKLDPEEGLWFLNFGRNLVFTTEAFYHAIFFGAIVAVLRSRFVAAFLLAVLLSASHPFTGVQLILVLAAWAFLERIFWRRDEPPRWFILATVSLIALHVVYYLVFLPLDPAHRKLMEQWKLPWLLQAQSFIPAYAIVGGLAAWRLRTSDRARQVLARADARLLLVWFLVSFALANHEFAIDPVQPLHFTRGYIWTPLFLLGAPALIAFFDVTRQAESRRFKWLALPALVLIMSDNILWVADRSLAGALTAPHRDAGSAPPRTFGFQLTDAQRDVLRWLNRPENVHFVVVAEDWQLRYLTTVYTPLRSWKSHQSNTPWSDDREAELRRFFSDGTPAERWSTLPLLIIYNEPIGVARRYVESERSATVVYRNPGFVVYRVVP